MKPGPWVGACRPLPILVLLSALNAKADLQKPKERHYYIAAVEIDWNYSGNDTNRLDTTYKKVVFREYDKDFRQAKTHPPWLGLLGPTLRAEEGETIVVTFRNMATREYSIHPHGVAYGKQSEGANYFDNTSQKEKEDDIVQPNDEHVYYWEVTPEVSPLPDDPDCLTYTYISHQNVVQDYNSGLIGALLICKAGTLDETGKQVSLHKDYVFLFGVFDEKQSWYTPNGHSPDDHVYYTINGYTEGSLPDASICANAPVGLHLVGMSSESEVFSVHMNGQVLMHNGHKVSSVGLISGSSATAKLVAPHAGRWLLSSLTTKHMEAGMHGFVDVRKCKEFKDPVRRMTIYQQRQSKEWKYYIAAEEIVWDYSNNHNGHIDEDYKLQYLRQSANRIGAKYKKAVYTRYKNESFIEKLENEHRRDELGLLGPVIRAQIRDVITIVFKNLASRPYSIYPHGLTVGKSEEGANYPEGGNQSHGVQPGETHTYVWKVLEENEPLDADSRCLTRMYHSAVDVPRDIASGLIGALLICKSESLDVRNVQLRADKEQHAVFSVLDENKSWYLDDNIRNYCDRSKVNKADPEFYKSNVMHTINGYAFESGPNLGFCNGEVATWHVSSIGAQDYIQTATFYGHPFELNQRTEDFLSLYPMTGETVTITMDNIGLWLLASLNTHETTKGMRVKFQDVECYRYNQYEYEYKDTDTDTINKFTEWKPLTLKETKKEEEISKSGQTKPVEEDYYTDMNAELLGLRSLRNQSSNSEVEVLDFSSFDYDVIDIPAVDGDTNLKVKDTKDTTVSFSNTTPNNTQWKDADYQNHTESSLQNTSLSKHATPAPKDIDHPFFFNDTTVLNSHSVLLNNQSTSTTNISVSVVGPRATNATVIVAGTVNSTLLNITGSTLLNATDPTVCNITRSTLPNTTDSKLLNATGSRLFNNTDSIVLKPTPYMLLNQTGYVAFNATDLKLLNATGSIILNAAGSTVLGNVSAESANFSTGSKELTSFTKGTQHTASQPTGIQEATNQTIPVQSQDNTDLTVILTGNSVPKEQMIDSVLSFFNETTVLNSHSVLLHNQSTSTTNISVSVVGPRATNATVIVAGTVNSTLLNITGSTLINATDPTVCNITRSTLPNATGLKLLNATGSITLNAAGSTVLGNVSAESANFSTGSKELTSFTKGTQHTASQPTGIQEATNQTIPVQSQDNTNLTVILTGNSVPKEQTIDSNPLGNSHDIFLPDDSEVRLTRGDVFFYSVPVSDNSIGPSSTNITMSQNSTSKNDHNMMANNVSAVGTNQSFSLLGLDIRQHNISSMVKHAPVGVEGTGHNEGNSTNSTAQQEFGIQINATESVNISAKAILENTTHILQVGKLIQNGTINVSKSSSVGMSSDKGFTHLGELLNTSSLKGLSKETRDSSNHSLSNGSVNLLSSDELSSSESIEEVFIYVKENKSEAIKTVSLRPRDHNWTYDESHSTVPEEIPDLIKKYFINKIPRTTPLPQKYKKVNLRKIPKKGEGLKTRRRKEYKPQARSGLPFSPRGLNPELTPRGARPNVPHPVTNEEALINTPIIIGLPRPDFSDYQLYVPAEEIDHPEINEQDLTQNEYEYVSYKDPYSSHEDIKNLNLDETTKYYLKLSGPDVKTYFIAAEEVEWDYAGYGKRRQEKSEQSMRKTTFTKVVFRGYLDASFKTPYLRGEMDEHLGILGPVIKAEVGQSIMIVFKNRANRPYSLHPNGVSYTKQFEGLSYEDGSKYWHKYDNEVLPNTTYTYIWKISPMVGPAPEESECRTWVYYSGVNPERDIHSGLIGPLLVCREGTLKNNSMNSREFVLLFMTFDESQSWYHNRNQEISQRRSPKKVWDENYKENLKFHSINGIIYSLKGLRMYTSQLVRWHLINMGSTKDVHSIYFHGQTFKYVKTKSYRQAVFPLLPGSFATLEMFPSKPGLWQLETEVGLNQKKGMQTLFLVLDKDCYHPLGLESGSVKDDQITANDTRGFWEPHHARLNNQGKYNAWSTEKRDSWIQVDFQRPVVISMVATQGARQFFQTQYATNFSISYSNDRRKWIFYKGDSREFLKTFQGNKEAYGTKENIFFPPLVGRYIRLHPITWNNAATIRMEFYGCELDGCSVPLGMESRLIEDRRITASSEASSWFNGPWKASLGRLNNQGSVNAWKAKHNDMNQWLQVELRHVMKITGIITQGAKSMTKEMYVIQYALQYSNNGIHWTYYREDDDDHAPVKMFDGNTNNNDHVKNYIFPPIFSRFIRIVPKGWWHSITMRVELLGCDFE